MSGLQRGGSASAAATSQTATPATDNTSQTIATGSVSQQAQASLTHSLQALQAMQAAQSAARNAAINGANNLGLNPLNPGQTLPTVGDGLGGNSAIGLNGGLVPAGSPLTPLGNAAMQIVNLGANGKGALTLKNGGTVTLPKGTPGNDTVSVSGAGSIVSSGGTVTANAGSLTTNAGGTLATTNGGSISVTGGSSTLAIVNDTNLTSSVAGVITLAGSGTQVVLPAGQAVAIPAGSNVTFSGTAAGTVNIAGAGTVTLGGAGTLTLAASGGGSITTNAGTASFTSGVSTTLPAGSTIDLNGAGSINFAGGTGGNVPVIVPTAMANYTTSGTLLTTTGYNVPTGGANPWINITGISQSIDPTNNHVTDTITQGGQQALLYWNQFDIGRNTTLSFDQSKGGANVGQWVAINEITDPSLHPSQILGSIDAPGQVYVINQNGIIFGGSSQVNVGALTASALALNPAYIGSGLLNDANNGFQFQFSSLFATTTALTGPRGHQVLVTTVAPLWTAPTGSSSQIVSSVPTGDVTVDAGAELTTPTNAEHQGGRIALIGPNVTNDGTISTPDGQTILAAGLQVGFLAHNSNDPTLRGLDTFVGAVSAGSSALPTGTFVFNGLSTNDPLTFQGSGQVGTYTTPGGAVNAIMGGTPLTIPVGSSVTLSSGSPAFAAVAAGTATNNGDIESPRASVTMEGAAVNQFGIINDSTSVTLNGRIDLLADYNAASGVFGSTTTFYPFSTGTVTLGGQSVTQILPETSSTETTVGTQLPASSLVNIQGLSIDLLSGSLLLAPGANVPPAGASPAFDLVGAELTSGVTLDAGSWTAKGSVVGQRSSTFSNDTGQISLDSGAVVDVSGSQDVSASVSEDVVAVQLRGPELANSPLQRAGTLRGTTVYVDLRNSGVFDGTPWIGTPIGDVSGYINDVGRTVGELTTNGGTVSLFAGNAVNAAAGSSINVSGGWINYAGATVPTTQVNAQGTTLDISQANPNIAYQGLYGGFTSTSSKWGVSQSFINSLVGGTRYDAGYVQGGSGGAINIAAPNVTLSGNLLGTTVAGSGQRTAGSSLSATYAGSTFLPTLLATSAVPEASQLSISFLQHTVAGASNVYGTTSADVVFQTNSYLSQNAPAANQVLLSQDILNNDGFGNLSIDTNAGGTITVPAGVSLQTLPGGSISFLAANIDIEGKVAAPGGGALNFTVDDQSPVPPPLPLVATPPPDPDRGHFTLGADASLSASGLLVDDRISSSTAGSQPFATSGGTVSIKGLNLNLAQGSSIDVSGGAVLGASGGETFGNAGSITILGGQDPGFKTLVATSQFILGSTMTGYSGNAGGGGKLTIQAPLVQIGGATLQNGDSSTQAFQPGETSVASNGTTLWLDKNTGAVGGGADFFSKGGFASYTIAGLGQIETDAGGNDLFNAAGDPIVSPALLITSDTHLDPVVQKLVTQVDGGVELVPETVAQASQLLPSQRSPVNLTFEALGITSGFAEDGPPAPGGGAHSSGGGLLVRGDLVMQAGATIQTDPQTNSSHGVSLLAPSGLVAVLGSIDAPAGTITITGGDTTTAGVNGLLFYESNGSNPFPTVDLGPDSVLSTKGAVELTFNPLGFNTGTVLPGGNVNVTGNIVAEAGAVVDVSGASGILSETPSALGQGVSPLSGSAYVRTLVESSGGSISLNASQLLYNDATLLGNAGGSMAQGGTLSVASGFAVTLTSNVVVPTPVDVSLIVSQQGLNGGFSLPSDASTGLGLLGGQPIDSTGAVGTTVNNSVGGEPVDSYFAANPNLFVSHGADKTASDNGGQAGGFASLNLAGTLDFAGPVSITAANSIRVATSTGNTITGESGGVIYGSDHAPIVLTAPYVNLNGAETSLLPDVVGAASYPGATGGLGSLTVNASVLADVGNLSLQNIGTLTFNSQPNQAGDVRGIGTLQVAGQINLNAAQVYPPTESVFTIMASDVVISSPLGQALPSLPLSAGGTLNIDATTIEQDGVLRAPFGTINLGTSATQSVVLSAGSITSVSAVDPSTGQGITIPYGIVDASGSWFDPLGNDITLTGPPTKAVHILGQQVQLQTGSTVDIAGGGDLYAYQFIPGTGGNKDILASTGSIPSSTSFAILPGYSLAYAPDGTYAQSANLATNGVADVGYFNTSLALGEQVYLNASKDLAAGFYTLLPARYAALPGAFLISPGTGGAPGASTIRADGSSLVSGYTLSALNPTTSPVFNGYQIYSNAEVLDRAPYSANLANTYFAKNAGSTGSPVPRLPQDAGQLVLDASQSMTIEGTLLSQAAAGGQGGEVDIASTENIDIVDSTVDTSALAGTLILDSSQLTNFGAGSLLIGGFRTTTASGTAVTVTTSDLEVDNGNASTSLGGATVQGLAAPDITLVSNQDLQVDSGSIIEQFGQLPGAAPTLTLQGNGALLRISSDPSAQIVRQGVTADVSSVLSIGSGAQLLKSGGTAAGSLILDSTSLVSLAPSATAPPVLMAKSLTLDSSLINIELGTPQTAPASGLVITAPQLDSLLASTQSLSLLSYSSIAFYGGPNGGSQIGTFTTDASGKKIYQLANLALHADSIYYADTQDSSGITINAQTVTLDNLPGGSQLPVLTGLGSATALTINAQTVMLGSNAMHIDGFDTVALNADSAILLRGLGVTTAGSDATPVAASFSVAGSLALTTPLITGATAPDQAVSSSTSAMIDEAITAGGALTLQAPTNDAATSPAATALATTLVLSASSITQNFGSVVRLHSGSLALEATGATGSPGGSDIAIHGTLDVSGTEKTYFNLPKYTDGGQISLASLQGNVTIGAGGLVDVSAASGNGTVDSGVGNGGALSVSAAGLFTPGQIRGGGGVVATGTTTTGTTTVQGNGGTFALDAGTLAAAGPGAATLDAVESALTGFSAQTIRDRNDSTVTVSSGTSIKADSFDLSADKGSIVVAGTIDASHVAATDSLGNPIDVGGNIALKAGGSVTLPSTGVLTVAGNQSNNAGQGGSVSIQAGGYEGVAVSSSSAGISLAGTINLANANGTGGTLNLRAPQVEGGAYVAGSTYTPVAVNAAGGGAPVDVAVAAIPTSVVEGASSMSVEGFYVQDAQQASAPIDNYEAAAESNAAAFMAQASTIENRIFGSPTASNVHIRPGEEIDNSGGSLELVNSWDLSSLRYGAPLLNAQGQTVTNAAGSTILSEPGVLTLRAAGNVNVDFLASLNDGFDGSLGVSNTNVLLPVGSQSWTYNITAGADFTAANTGAVQTPAALQTSGAGGSLQVGYQTGFSPTLLSNFNPNTASQFFQTLRTGTGNITINAGGDVLLLNNLATIYTAGAQVDATLGGTFVPPSGTDANGMALPATYSSGGGNVSITARDEIAHETYDTHATTLLPDSSAELPTNWLDREGSAAVGLDTTWWVDFTNFFEGVGALGGGNVTLTAGGSVVNVDAVAPTNARYVNGSSNELGGGDVTVRAGNNIDGGVYYVERGQGTLVAGGNIQTNATRAAVALGLAETSIDWLPTTLFLGKGSFSLSAAGNALFGPVANPFLLPQSYNNIASDQDLTSELSYFSTYAGSDAVNVSADAGTVTIQNAADGAGEGSLNDWYVNIQGSPVQNAQLGSKIAAAEPWLLLVEATQGADLTADFGPSKRTVLGSFSNVYDGVTALLPPTLRVTANSGDINLVGSLTLSPSSLGTVNLVADGSVNAFEVNQFTSGSASSGSGLINLSDADPNALPSVASPLTTAAQVSNLGVLFTVTAATTGLTLQAEQNLHADINGESLHQNDPNPVYIFAGTGDISGLNLFSAKNAQVIAGRDITDIGLYIQNNNAGDVSLVDAGRDIIAYDASSLLRTEAGTGLLGYNQQSSSLGAGRGAPNSGDIQISGPGTLEVLAGRNFTLGDDAGANPNDKVAGDGLFSGLTSVGGSLNPALPFGGATLVAAAGLGGPSAGLPDSSLDFNTFINQFLDPTPTSLYAATYLPDLGNALGLTNASNDQVWSAFQALGAGQKDQLALDIFYLVLRDAGRDHNNSGSPGFGNFDAANQAIGDLFPPTNTYSGDINVTSREIKTTNGGDIDLLTPGGGLTVGIDLPSGQAVDQGILTVDGGNISIFADGNVTVGTSRIFTLHGGNEIIWSTHGNIAAGASSKTVLSAPPTRVLVDPTSGAVSLDLAGLATGGGIGVLASVVGAPAGDVDLIAPAGIVDAGDAGIRASGNLNIAALKVVNADNISVGGKSTGVPVGASVNIGALTAASSAAGSATAAASNAAANHQIPAGNDGQDLPSIITVDVLGYGGGDED